MSVRQIHVFISHAWDYSVDYDTLAEWVFERKWYSGQASLQFCNFSIPKNNPIHNAPTSALLKEAIFNQIKRSHVVVIPTGMYAAYSNWIQKEIDGAKLYKKPILAVVPRGQIRKASVVAGNAAKVVGWNSSSVVDGIWDLYRAQ